jgi:hypothetical protein
MIVRPFESIFVFKKSLFVTSCAHNFWNASLGSPFAFFNSINYTNLLGFTFRVFQQHQLYQSPSFIMLVSLTGDEIPKRVDLLQQCYAAYLEVADLRVTYEIPPKKSSVVNVKLNGE